MKTFQEIASEFLAKNGKLVIDMGCGSNKKANTIGIDILQQPGVDLIFNLEEGLPFIPDNSIDEFVTSHFLEHVENFELLIAEIYRTLKPNGIIQITVPHFSNPYYYSDYTHKRFFGLYSFDYFSDGTKGLRRKVPIYNNAIHFKIIIRKLIFRSPVFFITNLIKKHLWTRLFNSSKYMQEFYEDLFSKHISCYEIKFVLKAIKNVTQ